MNFVIDKACRGREKWEQRDENMRKANLNVIEDGAL